jgi:eukaryotic-like serine/threonine-protein kinase
MGRQYVCQACGRRLTVPNELFAKKVRGRIVNIKCKGCGKPVSIDGTVPPPTGRASSSNLASQPGRSQSSRPAPDYPADETTHDIATGGSFADVTPSTFPPPDDPGDGRFSHVDGPLPLRTPTATIGRYALFDQFAEGGIATVHFGRLDGAGGFSRVVAIKRLMAHLTKNEEFTAMLLKEARLAARVRHPNVVPTLDVVVSQGDVLLILEYVHGEALSTLVRIQAKQRKDHMPLDIAATIMHDVLSGLCAVHEATDEKGRMLGLVHRDISPPNIIVGADGYARVLDFGIAKALEHIEESMPNRLKGKIGYMSPEQIRGEGATQSSDVFAAGVILWELLATRRLFSASNEADRMKQIVGGNYPKPSQFRSDVPEALQVLAMRALAASPQDRYQNAREFSEALEEAAPRASARRVSEWVNDLAKPTLIHRAHMIAQVENWERAAEVPALSAPYASNGPLILPPQALRMDAPRLDSPNSVAKTSRSPSQPPMAKPKSGPPNRSPARLLALISAVLLIIAAYYMFVR